MAASESRERAMSLDQQPAPTDYSSDGPPKRGRGERLVVLASVVVTVLSAIGIGVIFAGGDEEPLVEPTAQPSAAAPSIAPSAAPVVQTPEDLAIAEAKERYAEFLRVDDQVGQGGYRSSAPYDAVTVSPERDLQERAFRIIRQRPGATQRGSVEIVSLGATSVALTASPGDYPKIVLQACLDVSGVDVVDGTGKSLVVPERVDRPKSVVTMYQYEVGTKGAELGGWYVYEDAATGESC
jgi:hypothetical protein